MGNAIGKERCPRCAENGNDKSGDNLVIYDDGGKVCFRPGCGYTVLSDDYKAKYGGYELVGKPFDESVSAQIRNYTTDPNGFRGLTRDTCTKFRVRHVFNDRNEVVEQYYPATINYELSGYKVRKNPKDFDAYGTTGKACDMFGQAIFRNSNSKTVIITGGELDAMSAYQMLCDYQKAKGNGEFEPVPVVSCTVGEGGTAKQIQAHYEWFSRFDKIILCLDNDDAGKRAAEECMMVLPKGKAYRLDMTLKDPNKYLEEGRGREFVAAYWAAKPIIPAGVIGSDDLYDRVIENATTECIPLPEFMEELAEMMGGEIPLGYIVNFASASGAGKCLGKGTPILMANGEVKPVEEVVVGDRIMGVNNQYRKVLSTTTGRETLYKIKQGKGDDFVVNESHILSFICKRDKKSKGWKKGDIVNLSVLEYLALPKSVRKRELLGYKVGKVEFQNSRDVWEPYMFGYWVGDGNSNAARITVGDSDREVFDIHLDQFLDRNEFGVSNEYRKEGAKCSTIAIVGGFHSRLAQMGVMENKHIPKLYLTAPYADRLELAAGIIDSDGSFTNNCYDLITVSNQLTVDYAFLFRSIGLNVSVNTKFVNGKKYNRLTISGDTSIVPVKYERKKCDSRKQIKNHLHYAIEVEKLEEGDYYGFELDGDRLFVLGDFTVTHNTTIVNEMIYHWIFNCPVPIGVVSMELDAGQYGETMLSRHLGRKISLIPGKQAKLEYLQSEYVRNKARELFRKEDGSPRWHLVDDRDGSLETIQATVEQLIISCGCRVIILDPLQDLLDGLSNEEQAVFMRWQKRMVKSHKVTFINISHVRKNSAGQQANSTGAFLSEEDMSGSSTIFKSGGANVLFGRNKYAEDPVERNTITAVMSKCRWTGLTGPAGQWYYDNIKHMMMSKRKWVEDNNHIPTEEAFAEAETMSNKLLAAAATLTVGDVDFET